MSRQTYRMPIPAPVMREAARSVAAMPQVAKRLPVTNGVFVSAPAQVAAPEPPLVKATEKEPVTIDVAAELVDEMP
jgi:hypothetical protein